MSGTRVQPVGARPGTRPGWHDPVAAAIVACTALALALRLYQLARPGYLLGLTEYDDGPYFGSAVRLVGGSLPYRDFVLVQPPGITLLMAPVALAGKAAGTAAAMAAGRVLTALASVAGVTLLGLLVRHRGLLATVLACGVLAVYPDSIAAAQTVLVEPWLVLFCLAGALAVFDRDRLAGGRRLLLGGAGVGFAGAVEAWAIVPALVMAALLLPRPRRALLFAGGVAAGFAVPVLPFAALAPHRFYQSLITAQIGPRAAVARVPLWYRLHEMTGLSDLPTQPHALVAAVAVAVVLLAAGGLAAASLATRRPPAPLEVFALATAAGVVGIFLWPSQFHYHFAAFLGPFLALAVALPVSRLAELATGAAGGAERAVVTAGVIVLLGVFTVVQVRAEQALRPKVAPWTLASAQRKIPAGACVATDEVSLLLLSDRFTSRVPGCSLVLDGLGTDLALSGGLKPSTGAGAVPAVAAVWRREFAHAQFAWFSRYEGLRIAWSPALRGYFAAHFAKIWSDRRGDALYRRR